MKSTGIVRKIDHQGRIVLPMELRKTMNIKEGDPLEIFVDEESIILFNMNQHVFSAQETKLRKEYLLGLLGKIKKA